MPGSLNAVCSSKYVVIAVIARDISHVDLKKIICRILGTMRNIIETIIGVQSGPRINLPPQ